MKCMLIILTATAISFATGKGEVLGKNETFASHICSKFFYRQNEPMGLSQQNSARICQMYDYNGVISPYFASLYDRDRRMPLYSAYVFKTVGKGKRPKKWMIEPQLAFANLTKCMAGEGVVPDRKQLITSQAVNDDYKKLDPRYNRGHLNPRGHQNTTESRRATFTLTNIVPQTVISNGKWALYESSIVNISKYYQCSEIFLVTGVIPTKINPNERVNIPSHMWSAYCCVDQNGMPIRNGAALISNTVTPILQNLSLQDLESMLHKVPFFANYIQIFYNRCKKLI
ncbi:endonuclease domain-containing 1 protein-like [Protopterus annectens]|uniref:endonuclease domain-containing 1 protein-like n=1 Tax=Protopterus annectens TaxID=7888 RepID=UPI001CFB7E2F|nr:endonuclease domain-containing 1 protein-like [Protopterus annectens]